MDESCMTSDSNIFGKRIGRGKTRIVYAHSKNPNWVVKQIIQKENPSPKSNQIEWNVWLAVKDTPFADLFCPCVELTDDGHIIMLRCNPIQKEYKKIPTILDVRPPKDTKNRKNYGLLGDRSVLIDYGHLDFAPLVDALNQYKSQMK